MSDRRPGTMGGPTAGVALAAAFDAIATLEAKIDRLNEDRARLLPADFRFEVGPGGVLQVRQVSTGTTWDLTPP